MSELQEELRDLTYELDHGKPLTRADSSTLINSACYLGKKLFNIPMPDDFKPRGKAWVTSSTIKKEVYILNEWLKKDAISPAPEKDDYSSFRKLGSLLSDYEEDDIRLASIYLIYDEKGFSAKEAKKAKKVIDSIVRNGQQYFPRKRNAIM